MSEPYHYNGPFQMYIERSSDPNARRLEYLRWLIQRSRGAHRAVPDAVDRRAPVSIGSGAEDHPRKAA